MNRSDTDDDRQELRRAQQYPRRRLFAGEAIPEGTCIYQFVPGIDIAMTAEQAARHVPQFKRLMTIFAYVEPADGKLVISVDNSRFMIHDDQPNTRWTGPLAGQAGTSRSTRRSPAITSRSGSARSSSASAIRKMAGKQLLAAILAVPLPGLDAEGLRQGLPAPPRSDDAAQPWTEVRIGSSATGGGGRRCDRAREPAPS